jgi:SWI/SNF-related matrix-associated actin-dependent regulator 1 of chromatin subfamily A
MWRRHSHRFHASSHDYTFAVPAAVPAAAAAASLQGIRVTKVEPLPDLVLKVLSAHRRQPDDSSLYEALGQLQLAPDESLEQRMMPFQRQGVQFGLRVGGRLLIGDEMGLGKTVQACALTKCYQAEWPVLVVTPSSLRWGLGIAASITAPKTLPIGESGAAWG